MKNIKIIFVVTIFVFLGFIGFVLVKIKNQADFKQKIYLAMETRKALEHLMVDLSQASENNLLDLPADGQWHHRVAFSQAQDDIIEYSLHEGHLWKSNKGVDSLIADHLSDLSIRREPLSPGILEVKLTAQNSEELISNFKIRIHA